MEGKYIQNDAPHRGIVHGLTSQRPYRIHPRLSEVAPMRRVRLCCAMRIGSGAMLMLVSGTKPSTVRRDRPAVQWVVTATLENSENVPDRFAAVADTKVDRNGNTYVVGSYRGTLRIGNTLLPPTPKAAAFDFVSNSFLAKIDPAGAVVWARSAGGRAEAASIAPRDGSGPARLRIRGRVFRSHRPLRHYFRHQRRAERRLHRKVRC